MSNSHTIPLNNLQISYEVTGQGPDVVFVHGWASSRQMWASLMTRLAPEYRCWALDLPGYGDSDKPADSWYSIPNFTELLFAFTQALQLERLRLVGHSMGGMIVLNFAARHPTLLTRLVPMNPVVTGKSTLRALAYKEDLGRRLLDLTLRVSPKVWTPAVTHPAADRVPGVQHVRRRTEEFHKGTLDSIIGSGNAVMSYDVSPYLEDITAPTHVILGMWDVAVLNSEGKLAAARIPNARLSILSAGHMVTDDRPIETLKILREFFV